MGKWLARALKLLSWLLVLAFVGVCALLNFANAPEKRERDRLARANAERVIGMLASHHSDHGRYPASLDDLAPAYAAEVPGPREGGSFHYRTAAEGQDFTLGYYAAPMGTLPSDEFHSFDARSGAWRFEIH